MCVFVELPTQCVKPTTFHSNIHRFYFTTANLLHWMIEKKPIDSINGVCFVIEIYSCFTIYTSKLSIFVHHSQVHIANMVLNRDGENTKKTETTRKFNTFALLFHEAKLTVVFLCSVLVIEICRWNELSAIYSWWYLIHNSDRIPLMKKFENCFNLIVSFGSTHFQWLRIVRAVCQ